MWSGLEGENDLDSILPSLYGRENQGNQPENCEENDTDP